MSSSPTEQRERTESAGKETVEVTLPDLGEEAGDALVVAWEKQPGEWVDQEEPICVVSAQGLRAAVGSSASGRVVRLLAAVGTRVGAGASLAEVETEAVLAEAPAEAPEPLAEAPEAAPPFDPPPEQPETQEVEVQEPEIQELDVLEPEVQELDVQEPDAPEPEAHGPDVQEPEVQEPEAQEPETEVEEPEVQEPEIEAVEPEVEVEEVEVHEPEIEVPEPEFQRPDIEQPEVEESDGRPPASSFRLDMTSFHSPAVKRLATEHGLDLTLITGTGVGGRVRKDDVLEHLERRSSLGTSPAEGFVQSDETG
jgi:pyruvate/2-oxoglutarate dehydrogenase complex dihydrolipoamide acyltransferase (E2) component